MRENEVRGTPNLTRKERKIKEKEEKEGRANQGYGGKT